MISLIIPPTLKLDFLRRTLRAEYKTAMNIKNNNNRKSVKRALINIQSYIKNLKEIPKTGIALFSEEYI